jgi:hypothetical protein
MTAERALAGKTSLFSNLLLVAAQHEPLSPVNF